MRAYVCLLSPVPILGACGGVFLYLLEKDYGGGSISRSGVKKFVVKH